MGDIRESEREGAFKGEGEGQIGKSKRQGQSENVAGALRGRGRGLILFQAIYVRSSRGRKRIVYHAES
jgi:hypothetical protein